jgi:hypothetical protein
MVEQSKPRSGIAKPMNRNYGIPKMQPQKAPAGRLRSAICAALVLIAPAPAALVFIAGANAQENDAQSVLEPSYTVELIVFAYRTADSGSEVFVPDKPTLVPDAEEEMPNEDGPRTFSELPEALPPDVPDADDPGAADEQLPERERIELHVLEPDAYTMDDVHRQLERLDAYEPVMRAAWTQTTPPRDVSPAVHLRALGNPPPGLDGSVTLYRGRYLHLVVDLALDAEPSEQQAASATDRLVAYGDGRIRSTDDGTLSDVLRQPVRYRIFEDRIMKTGDIRYFDHPRFGVIAKVMRPEEEAASAGAGDDGLP